MFVDQVMGGLGALAAFYAKAKEQDKENTVEVKNLMIALNDLTVYLVEIDEVIKKINPDLKLQNFDDALALLKKFKKLIDEYHQAKNERLGFVKAGNLNKEFGRSLKDITDMRAKIQQNYTLFRDKHNLSNQAQSQAESAAVSAPAPEPAPPTSHLVTNYLKANAPALALAREIEKLKLDNELTEEGASKLASANYNLGRMYRKGEGGVAVNLDEAMKYYECAREQSHNMKASAAATLDIAAIENSRNNRPEAIRLLELLANAPELTEKCPEIQATARNNLKLLQPQVKHA